MSVNAQEFYSSVITDVIERMRNEFVQEGVSEDILEKLKINWEKKLKEKTVDGQNKRTAFEAQNHQP
jgi:hypothetical protein